MGRIIFLLKTLSFELGRLLKCATHICTLHREYLKDKKFADGKMKFISKRLKTHNVQKQVETVASSQILTLHFVVLSFDRYSRDDVVGEVMGGLEGIFFLQFLPRSWWSWRGWTSPPLRPAPSHWPERSLQGATN